MYLCPISWVGVSLFSRVQIKTVICVLSNLYVGSFGDVGDEVCIVLLDEEGGEQTWTQTVPAACVIFTRHLCHHLHRGDHFYHDHHDHHHRHHDHHHRHHDDRQMTLLSAANRSGCFAGSPRAEFVTLS